MSSPFSSTNPVAPRQSIPVPNITIGNVAPDNESSKHLDEGNSFHTDYEIFGRYVKNSNLYMLSVSSPGGFEGNSSAFVQLGNATLLWVVDWSAARVRSQPDIPDFAPSKGNWILMGESYTPTNIILAADGITPVYKISGTYVYGNKKPSAKTIEDVEFSRPPYVEDGFDRSMPASKLKKGLSDRGKP